MKVKNIVTTIVFVVMFVSAMWIIKDREIEVANKTNIVYNQEKAASEPLATSESTSTVVADSTTSDPIVYDGMTMTELSAKLDNSLGSDLTGTGYIFANKAVQLGIDPYLAVAISLHETGCAWNCSGLVTACNNVGGMGGSGCNGYAYFNTLEEGIDSYMDNLAQNYIYQGLNTPELMARKYTGYDGTSWINAINNYISQIKSR
jgi:3',5'-cyclic AMP phosphodiesterase CpdA